MRFRREQCFGNSQIWLKKYKTLSEVVTRRPRNARNRAYDQYSSPFLLFLLREKKHFHTLSTFLVLMLNCQRCLILSVNSKLSEAPLWLWSAVLSTVWWDGGCFVLLQTSGASARRHRGWLAAVQQLAGLTWMWLHITISYLEAVILIAEFWSLKQKRSSGTDICTRCQNAVSLVMSNKSAAVILGMLKLCAWLDK